MKINKSGKAQKNNKNNPDKKSITKKVDEKNLMDDSDDREVWKGGNMLYPLPVVLVGVKDKAGHENLITVAWAGTICTNPPMVSISVRPERYSYHMLMETGDFSLNLATEQMTRAVDYCGVKSGRDTDKWKDCNLTPVRGQEIKSPLVKEAPVSLECRITGKKELGSHTIFMAEVLKVHASKEYMDEKGRFHLERSKPIVYSHGEYFSLGKKLGKFGYSVKKTSTGKKKKNR